MCVIEKYFFLQKLSDADKIYGSSAAAYMSDPRLCHTTALRLGTPTPDNKNGKNGSITGADTDNSVDKLIPVKEEEGVTDQVIGVAPTTEFVVTGVGGGSRWCPGDTIVDHLTHDHDHSSVQYQVCSVSSAGTEASSCVPSCTVPAATCSVFSLSVSADTAVSPAAAPAVVPLPVTEVRLNIVAPEPEHL